MKSMRMLKQPAVLAIILAALTLGGLQTKAQQIMAGWLCNSLPASGGTTPFAPTTSNPNLTIGPLTKGPGIGAVTTTAIFGGNTWTNAGVADSEANSISHGLYLTYSVTPNAGYTVSFTTNIMYYHNSATGPWTGELQFSTDGINYTDVASLPYSTAPNPAGVAETTWLTNNLAGVAALQKISSGTTAFFRIVNWGAYGTAGTWYIDSISGGTTPDFQVIGAVTSAGVAPYNLTVSPTSVTTNAGSTVVFSALANGDPASNFWYKVTGSATSLIATGNTGTLTLPDVLAGNSAG